MDRSYLERRWPMAALVKQTIYILAIGTDLKLVDQSKKLHAQQVEMLLVPNCEVAFRYLERHKDADEVWVYHTALEDWQPQHLKKAIQLQHPKVKVWFVATSLKDLMKTSPEIDWWILESK